VFFDSLTEDEAERSIDVVLSGGGTDGTLGLFAIKEQMPPDRKNICDADQQSPGTSEMTLQIERV
jgi:hypothetical protein